MTHEALKAHNIMQFKTQLKQSLALHRHEQTRVAGVAYMYLCVHDKIITKSFDSNHMYY